jgi:two-component system cell cycle response regulator DivK
MPKILLVEDNEMNRDMLSRRLQRKGYEVVLALDGQSGVEMSQTQAPDLILMDMSLPVLDGWEATRRLKTDASTRAHSHYRPHRACHVQRPGESPRSWL